jgi:ferredoxin/flavodoxin
MQTKLFYFSGTGNTFALANDIAGRIGSDLISISKIDYQERIHIDAERIIIVFPSYLAPVSGVPLIVERFVRKIDNINKLSIFAVCNCGGYESVNALPSLRKLRKIIKSCGGKLYAEYSVRLPMNNLDYDDIPIPISRDTEDIIRKSRLKISYICSRIIKGKKEKYKISKSMFMQIMTPFYRLMLPYVIKDLKEKAKEPENSRLQYFELMPLTDKSIVIAEKCIGCGICSRVCPVNNIKVVNMRPVFHHRCEICFACDEWCPLNAIHHWSRAKGVKYHHPEVTLNDMLNK